MIIRREVINAVLPATTSDDSRYALTSVQLLPDGRAVATDGKILLVATDKSPQKDDEFPTTTPAFTSSPDGPVLVEADVLRGLIATMPKKLTIPILNTLQVTKVGANGHVALTATDLISPRTATVDTTEMPTFPAWERVMPKEGQPCIRVGIAIDVLEQLIKAAKGAHGNSRRGGAIVLDVPTDKQHVTDGCLSSQMRVTINAGDVEVTGAVMPYRIY